MEGEIDMSAGERPMNVPMTKLIEGKTKIVWEVAADTEDVLIESKDDITAGDGERRDSFEGKAALATQTTTNCFLLLKRAGIPNHFLDEDTERTFWAERVNMIPLELVVRGIAFGSYLRRNPDVAEGTKFDVPVFEMYAKDDSLHDPLVEFDFDNGTARRYNPKLPVSLDGLIDETPLSETPFALTPEQLSTVRALAHDTFSVIEAAWDDQNVTLVDLKIECGITQDGNIVVADVIDNDSWRIWPDGEPSQMVDKQLFRDGKPLDTVAKSYAWVAEATNKFNPES